MKGGVEELTAQLGRELQQRGYEVLVVTNRWPQDLPEQEAQEGLDVTRARFTLPARRPQTLVSHVRGRRLGRAHLDTLTQPDLIHVQCASSQLSFMARYARERQVPLVITTQGETRMDAGGIYEKNPWLRATLRRASRQPSSLTACSAWTARATAEVAPRFAEAAVVLNGVTPGDWPLQPEVSDPVIGAWGRHVSQKGLDLLLLAFELVRQQEPRARLLIGGDGPETENLKANAGAGVTFFGALDRAGVADLLRKCRVVAVPSRIEPFGIVALEALASGRGLVYSVHGGLSEAAGGLGRAADPFDATHFASALLAELSAPTAGGLGRARAEELAWPHICDAYERVYASAMT